MAVMRRARIMFAFTSFVVLLLTFAPSAFAGVRDRGGPGALTGNPVGRRTGGP